MTHRHIYASYIDHVIPHPYLGHTIPPAVAGQALCAEEVAASEKSSQVQRFQREEQRIRTAVP